MKSLLAATLFLTLVGAATAQTNNSSSGSGIVIGNGDILTNWHVVEGCDQIAATVPMGVTEDATLVARDPQNDLAVIRVKSSAKSAASFRQGASIRAGDTVLASGYPLSGVLASSANISTGIVNALSGLSDDFRFIQISTPVQPGNSGGPLVDQAGHLVGIVTSKLNAMNVARIFGDIPQNVNFAIKADVVRTFLESRGINYATGISNEQLPLADVADLAKAFTAYIECRGSAAPVAGPDTAAAQRVVLYEEDPADAAGKRYVGSAIWRTETISPGPNQPPELAIRADVEIPDRKIAMTWSLRRNTDASLPASHTIEIMFKLPTDFAGGSISNVPGILMKQAEQTRGVPLAGLAVKVTKGFFLIGLSAVAADRKRNIQLLKERSWFDIPLVYANNRRTIVALEKGMPGERVFQEVFKAWKQ